MASSSFLGTSCKAYGDIHKGILVMHKRRVDPSSKEAAAAAETGAFAERRDMLRYKKRVQTLEQELHHQ